MNGSTSERMDAISQMAVEMVRQILAKPERGQRWEGALDKVDVPLIRLSLDLMTDQAAAREMAASIYKALSKAVEP